MSVYSYLYVEIGESLFFTDSHPLLTIICLVANKISGSGDPPAFIFLLYIFSLKVVFAKGFYFIQLLGIRIAVLLQVLKNM